MHFLAPWFWLLFPLFAGLLILLYLLKIKRRDTLIASVFLWERALQDLQANAPMQKLRAHLLFMLQLIILLLLVFALTRPAMHWVQQSGRRLVVIIDCSASMQATDVAPSRFALAQREARAQVEGMGVLDTMMIVAIGGNTQVATPFTRDQRTLTRAINGLRPLDTASDVSDALEVVSGLLHGKQQLGKIEVILFSDGALPEVRVPHALQAPIHYRKIGRRGHNIGFVMADIRRSRQGQHYQGLLRVRNTGATAMNVVLEQSFNGVLRDARTITIAAGGEYDEVIRALPASGGDYQAHLRVRDDLAVDNTVQLLIPPIELMPVHLLSAGNLFLQAALELDGSLRFTQSNSLPATLPAGTVLVVDNIPIATLPASVPALLIGPRSFTPVVPARRLGTKKALQVVDWDRQHPVMTHVDLADLQVAESLLLAPTGSARVLMESADGPLALADDGQQRRLLYLGWEVQQSDFPLRATFPIFIANAVEWLGRRKEQEQAHNTATGKMLTIPLAAAVSTVRVDRPDGSGARFTVNSQTFEYNAIDQVGIYQVNAGSHTMRFAANMLNAAESDTTPRDALTIAGKSGEVAASRERMRSDSEWWRPLLVLALLLLLIEWWVFHRRIG